MKDMMGNKLKIGDKVVFVCKTTLKIGNITKLYKNVYNHDECSVGRYTHILSERILKLDKDIKY